MTITRETIQLAQAAEMPGTRCDPEDEIWPCPYTVLPEPELTRELFAAAQSEHVVLDARRGWRADCVTFQPCVYARSQDRHVVKRLDVHGRAWTLTAVFDGVYPSVPSSRTCALGLTRAWHIASACRQVILARTRSSIRRTTFRSLLKISCARASHQGVARGRTCMLWQTY